MESIFDIGRLILSPVQCLKVGIILCEDQLRKNVLSTSLNPRRWAELRKSIAELLVLGVNDERGLFFNSGFMLWWFITPRPGVTKPDMGDDVKWSWFRSPIKCCYSKQNLLFIFCVFSSFNDDVPISVFAIGNSLKKKPKSGKGYVHTHSNAPESRIVYSRSSLLRLAFSSTSF